MDTATPATARFRDDELLEITEVASPWISSGLWTGLQRDRSADCDRITIHLSHGRAHYVIQRDSSGSTHLLYCLPDDWRLLIIGTLGECLQSFQTPMLQ
jgi:hypothetical protein